MGVFQEKRIMKKYIFYLLLYFVLSPVAFCYAPDWKNLHEQADKTDIVAAEDGLRKSGDSVDSMYILALIYLGKHRNDEALGLFEKIARLDPGSFEAEWGIAEVLRRQHRLGESQKILEKIIKEHPDFAPAYISLSYIRYIQHKFEDTVRLNKRVLQLGAGRVDETDMVRAYMMIGAAKGMLAHYGGPISKPINGLAVAGYIRAGEKIQPDNAEVLFGIGSYYLLAPKAAGKDIDKAEIYFNKAIKKDPLFVDVYVRLAQVRLIKQDEKGYQDNINKALLLDPGNEVALDIKSGACRFVCPATRD